MKENKTMDQIHRTLLKKYHALCGVLGLCDVEKSALLSGYGVESSRDLDTHDLVDLCGKLSALADEESGRASLDKLRKRLMAAIGGYLRVSGQFQSPGKIKGIACRASGFPDFNAIPRQRLMNLIHAFNNRASDIASVNTLQPGGEERPPAPLGEA